MTITLNDVLSFVAERADNSNQSDLNLGIPETLRTASLRRAWTLLVNPECCLAAELTRQELLNHWFARE